MDLFASTQHADPLMINVLTITSLFPNSEQTRHGVFVEERLRHLAATGRFNVQVVAPVPWFPLRSGIFGLYGRYARVPRSEERLGRKILHPRYLTLPKVGMTLAPYLYAAGIASLVRQLAGDLRGPVVLDGHFLYPDGVATALLAHQLGLPYILTARGQDVTLFPRHAVPRTLIRRACSGANRVITVSEALRELLLELGVAPERVLTLRNGVDLTRFRPGDRAVARAQVGFTRPTLLAVGHLIERKDHELMIRALPLVPGTDLVIVGEGPLRDRLLAVARELGVAERLRIVPNVLQHELVSYYAAATLSVLTSRHEGMPNVVLESLACGTPVVATLVEGVPELLDDPAAGLLVRERTPTGLAAGINAVLANLPAPDATRAHAAGLGWEPTIAGLTMVLEQAVERGRLDLHHVTGKLPV
ncbi:MAG: glycosyltransferase [Gammaproteobacteria bacterium]|nr:glycosyltransferase [Gammaproteobacteria bacterium]